MEAVELEPDRLNATRTINSHPTYASWGAPGRLSGNTQRHVLEKIVKSEEGKRKYPTANCHVCATHKKRKVKLGKFVSSA
jgi:hypothetical protein